MIEKIITNKILLGMCIVLIPISIWCMSFTVEFVLETRDRNTEIRLMKKEISEIKNDVNELHWFLIGDKGDKVASSD